MVDWEKQKKFQILAEHLSNSLEKFCGVKFSFDQPRTANRFFIQSERVAAAPFYEIEFTTEEKLAICIGDGVHYPNFTAIVQMSHCVNHYEDGWDFDREAIVTAATRIIELGRQLYEEHEKMEKSPREYRSGSFRDQTKL